MVDRSDWRVQRVGHETVRSWILHKHYAKRMPPISVAIGLFRGSENIGVCTFGPPARMLNDGYGLFDGDFQVDTYELNRLCVDEDLPDNSLSWFVARALNAMPSPSAIVSYADSNWGHHGYIYQATNWLYCGLSNVNRRYVDRETGEDVHARTVVSRYGSASMDHPDVQKNLEIQDQDPKYRYVYFVGNKREKREMRKRLSYEVLPYPKGENETYEAGKRPSEDFLLTRLRKNRRKE